MYHGLIDALIRGLIPIAVALVFAVSRRYLPVRTTRSFETTWSLVELDARFSTTQWIVGLSMVLMGVVIFGPRDPSSRNSTDTSPHSMSLPISSCSRRRPYGGSRRSLPP